MVLKPRIAIKFISLLYLSLPSIYFHNPNSFPKLWTKYQIALQVNQEWHLDHAHLSKAKHYRWYIGKVEIINKVLSSRKFITWGFLSQSQNNPIVKVYHGTEIMNQPTKSSHTTLMYSYLIFIIFQDFKYHCIKIIL